MRSPQHCRAVVLAVATLFGSTWANANCDQPPPEAARPAPLPPALAGSPQAPSAASTIEGAQQLASVLRTAVEHSDDVKAAEHSRIAAHHDLDQVRAVGKPRLALSANAGAGDYTSNNVSFGSRGTGAAALTLSGPVFDGGKLSAENRQREQLADASTSGLSSTRERVARETLLTLLDRNRYRAQLQVREQHVAKLSCLSELIDRIVEADRGRASEQIQARKTLRQAELARDENQAALRHTEMRLRQMLGVETLQDWPAVVAPLQNVPQLAQVLEQITDNPDIQQQQRQVEAQRHAADAVAAEQSPQIRWEAGYNARRQVDRNDNRGWTATLSLNHTFLDFGAASSAAAASKERAKAAARSLDQAITDRTRGAAVYYDTATNAFRRANGYGGLLQDSDKLRNATYVQWASLGRRSLFDLISSENDFHELNLAYVSAMFEGYAASVELRHLGSGLIPWMTADLVPGVYSTRPSPAGTADANPEPAEPTSP